MLTWQPLVSRQLFQPHCTSADISRPLARSRVVTGTHPPALLSPGCQTPRTPGVPSLLTAIAYTNFLFSLHSNLIHISQYPYSSHPIHPKHSFCVPQSHREAFCFPTSNFNSCSFSVMERKCLKASNFNYKSPDEKSESTAAPSKAALGDAQCRTEGGDERTEPRQNLDDCSCLGSPAPAAVSYGLDKMGQDAASPGQTPWGTSVLMPDTMCIWNTLL